jgi:hypothetical protein
MPTGFAVSVCPCSTGGSVGGLVDCAPALGGAANAAIVTAAAIAILMARTSIN